MEYTLSASLILLRGTQTDFEVLLIERAPTMTFPGFYVFPGGKLDSQDSNHDVYNYFGAQPAFSPYIDQVQSVDMSALKICCLRETYEETGVLLNCPSVVPSATFLEASRASRSKPDLKDLKFFLRILAPRGVPPNDTTFFVTQLQADVAVSLNPTESTRYEWLTPIVALKMYEQRTLKLFSPQVLVLYILSHFGSIESLMQALKINWYEIEWPEFSLRDKSLGFYSGDYRHSATAPHNKAKKIQNCMRFNSMEFGFPMTLEHYKPYLTSHSPYTLQSNDGVLTRKLRPRL